MRVTHHAGSRLVIWKHREHYIDVARMRGGEEVAECVRNGQVYLRVPLHREQAPEELIQLMKRELA